MWYVTMTDKFLSGWECNEKRISKVVIECETLKQAQDAQARNENRCDMVRVNITTRKPYYNSSRYIVDYRSYDSETPYRF